MKNRAKLVAMTVIGTLALSGLALGQGATDQPVPAKPAAPSNVDLIHPLPPLPGQPGATATDGRPQLAFEEMAHEFGRIGDQNDVATQFKFTNTGTGTLRFTVPFRATCGCTAGNPRSPKNPDVDQVEFAPGESGFIKVSFKPQGKHGDVSQNVTVTSNDPVQPEQILKINAFVRTTIAFDPPLVSFGEVRVGEVAKQIVRVKGPAPDFKVNYASTSKGRYISVKVLDTTPIQEGGEDLSQTTLELTFNGNAPRGSLQAVTTVRTSNENFPLKDLQVMAEVVGDLQVLPPRVNVGIIESGAAFTKTFRVNSRTGKPFKITHVGHKTTLPSPLEISVTPVEPGNETAYQVEVKGMGPSTPTPVSATISLTTDAPTDRNVEVALSGAVRPPVAPSLNQQLNPDLSPAGPGIAPTPAPARDGGPASDKPH